MLTASVRKGTSKSLFGCQWSSVSCVRRRRLRANHKNRLRGVEMELPLALIPIILTECLVSRVTDSIDTIFTELLGL